MEGTEKADKPGPLQMLLLRRRFVIPALVVLGLAPLAYWAFTVFIGANLHAVIPGQVYRAAQLSPRTLEIIVKRYGIRTIINLRGCSDTIPWYLEECLTAQRLNLNYEDIGFSAYRFPHENELCELVDVIEHAEYPIFLHCRRGADRTGLASAVALLMKTDTSLEEARRQLSIRFGHVSLGKPAHLKWFFDAYADWLNTTGQEHSPERFRHWARTEYRGGWYKCQFANFKQSEPRVGEHIACRVVACNIGLRTWQMRPTMAAGMHLNFWVRDAQDHEVAVGHAGLLEATVPPGERIPLTFAIPPLPAGRYQLFATLENANNFHLYQTGSEPLEVEFEVHE